MAICPFATQKPISGPSGAYTSDASSNLLIGDRGDAARAFSGGISDVRLYNRILSANEMMAIHRSLTGGALYTGHFLDPITPDLVTTFNPPAAITIPRRRVIE